MPQEIIKIVPVANMYLHGTVRPYLSHDSPYTYYSLASIKEINKQERFRNIDLIACWKQAPTKQNLHA